MIKKFVVAGVMSSMLTAGAIGAGTAAASPEHPKGNTLATCLSMREWVVKSGGHPGDCYWDAGKDSYEVANING